MTQFAQFRDLVSIQFDKMSKSGELFLVNFPRDDLWDAYLEAFPPGSNPIHIERREHDCSCCRQFVRDIGGVVAIKDGKVSTVWDIALDDDVYSVVAAKMKKIVTKASIEDIFRHDMKKVGLFETLQQLENGEVKKWTHFQANIQSKFRSTKSASVAQKQGEVRDTVNVFRRSLEEITPSSVELVEELIDQGSLYRGAEHLNAVKSFSALATKYQKQKTKRAKDLFVWEQAAMKGPSLRFRNTVIGTLLTDISNGVDLNDAVKAFESKVAPMNYKRPTALVTQSMIDKATKKVEELGIEDSLQRRYAVESDLTVNNVLFVDRSTAQKLNGGVLADLKPTAKGTKKTPDLSKVQEVTIDDFIENILPKVESLEVLFENRHTPNLVSLIAPKIPGAPGIFSWDNNFSWSYNGDVTDSVKEKVKAAGGNITGDVRVSLSWSNFDDLDLHVHEPNGYEIYFGNRGRLSPSGGTLDVDMNAGGKQSREPVENIVYTNKRQMRAGKYQIEVMNYSRRESIDVGFDLQVEIDGVISDFSFHRNPANNNRMMCMTLNVDNAGNITIDNHEMESQKASREVWGVDTEQYQKVKMLTLSPNHWDDQEKGNKHWFFVLDECINPDKARGFYNEFLRSDLTEERKVFELLGAKLKAEQTDEQLSGLGFSSTKQTELLCKVSGSFNRHIKIKF